MKVPLRPYAQRQHRWHSRDSGIRGGISSVELPAALGLPPAQALLESDSHKAKRHLGNRRSTVRPSPTPDSHSSSLLPSTHSLLEHTHAITHPGAGPGASQTGRYHRRAWPDSEKARDSGDCQSHLSLGCMEVGLIPAGNQAADEH